MEDSRLQAIQIGELGRERDQARAEVERLKAEVEEERSITGHRGNKDHDIIVRFIEKEAELKRRAEAAEKEVQRLRAALLNQLSDLHQGSLRPCPTCARSARALGLDFLGRCPRFDEVQKVKAALAGKKEAA